MDLFFTFNLLLVGLQRSFMVPFYDTFIRNLTDPLAHWHTDWLFPYPAKLAKEERISLFRLLLDEANDEMG